MPHLMTEKCTPAVATHLTPGERVELVATVMADPGVVRPVSLRDEAKNLLDPTVWIGLGAHPGELLRRLTWGRAVSGDEGSVALRLHTALDGPGADKLVVTGERLLVGSVDMRGDDPQQWRFTTVHSESRSVVVHAARAPGRLRRGRIQVRCADGSELMMWPRRRDAALLVAALNGAAND